jgi:hypothetical protein
MEIKLIKKDSIIIAEVTAEEIIISEVQDALDIMADCSYQGAEKILLYEKNLHPNFFDLKTKLAGDILQKFSNYRMSVAIIGDFSKYTSKSLRDFIYESNKGGRIRFVSNPEEALR